MKRQAGFSVIEVLLAATVFGMVVTALAGAIIYGRNSTADAGIHQRAMLYAEEGLTAAHNIGNSSFAALSPDGNYGLAQSGSQWTLSGTNDSYNIFTRVINITSVGTDRKLITSTVTWPRSGTSSGGTITLTTRVSNWKANTKLWSNAAIATADHTGSTSAAVKVATSGNYAYFVKNAASAPNFFIADISNPSGPSVIASSVLNLAGTPTNIAVSGGYAFITNSQSGGQLQVVSISNPSTPSLVKTLGLTGAGGGLSIAVSGSYAYITRASDTTAGANEFTVVNISNPASPTVVGGYNNNINMNDIYLDGNYAYVATSSTTTEMLVINIITPTAPALAASYNAPTSVASTAIDGYGNYIFLASGTTVQAVNITVPTTPTTISGITFTAASTVNKIDIDITQTYAFLATASTTTGVQVINVATPTTSLPLVKSVTTTTAGGIAYSSKNDVAVAASSLTTGEAAVVRRN